MVEWMQDSRAWKGKQARGSIHFIYENIEEPNATRKAFVGAGLAPACRPNLWVSCFFSLIYWARGPNIFAIIPYNVVHFLGLVMKDA
ncbi:hypothetical protein KSZ_72060 [Dictyobacter formicarum]|uniref:Uncharacterized protein n=1 Tax=Dictyobacter formicarum TaxID=2778368 RepID=A0ABQ3VSM4_9CHLR|nr:hypothetical protein KSZ_72060 [Dictyobacter formicarum]